MTRADMKFRFIIPVDEVNERGERAFLYDKARIEERDYKTFFAGEAGCYSTEFDITDDLVAKMNEGTKEETSFSDGATDGEKAVAFEASKLWTTPDNKEPELQERIDAYYKCKPLDPNCGTLEKFYGYPW